MCSLWLVNRALESQAADVCGTDWVALLDAEFTQHLVKYRKYKNTIRDLLRVIRNKKHHYRDLPEDVQHLLGPLPDGYLSYFLVRYPALLLRTFWFVRDHCAGEFTFRPYLHCDDSGAAD